MFSASSGMDPQDLLKAAEKVTAKNGGTRKMSALRGTQREEQPREREFPLELKFYMWGEDRD